MYSHFAPRLKILPKREILLIQAEILLLRPAQCHYSAVCGGFTSVVQLLCFKGKHIN